MSDELLLLPVPPAVNNWDVDWIVARALEVLRLGAGDPDAPRVHDSAQAACDRIDDELDNVEPQSIPKSVEVAVVQLTVEIYRTKDAPFGVVDAWSADAVAFRIPRDRLAGIMSLLETKKHRWGLS
jgi:hypothetical protein